MLIGGGRIFRCTTNSLRLSAIDCSRLSTVTVHFYREAVSSPSAQYGILAQQKVGGYMYIVRPVPIPAINGNQSRLV